MSSTPIGPTGRISSMVAWQRLRTGNDRFVTGRPDHLGQDAAQRAALSGEQRPFAVIVGCSDSRVAAEIVFDQGLGDLFVVRTSGHLVDTSALGSIEFAISVYHVSLVVVLGHDNCGAVASSVTALDSGRVPGGFLRDIVERVTPSVLAARRRRHPSPATVEDIEAEHVTQTAALIAERSAVITSAIAVSRCAVLGAMYRLADGRVHAVTRRRPR